MTIAQQFEQKGIEKGIQLGEQHGMEKGEREANLKIARSLLKMGMFHESLLEATGLTEADLLHISPDITGLLPCNPVAAYYSKTDKTVQLALIATSFQ